MAEKDRIGEAKMDDEITMKIERIEELLSSFAVNGLMDTASISGALGGRLSRAMVLSYTRRGDLDPVNWNDRPYVYTVGEVARFLMDHPKYLCHRPRQSNEDMTQDRIESLSAFVRNYVRKDWMTLLKVMDMDDIVQDVLLMFMRWKRVDGVSDATVVYRALSKIWRKNRKRMGEVVTDTSELGKEEEDD